MFVVVVIIVVAEFVHYLMNSNVHKLNQFFLDIASWVAWALQVAVASVGVVVDVVASAATAAVGVLYCL